MFTIANPFLHQTALGTQSNLLLSQNPLVQRATDLLDETLHCMIASQRFFLLQAAPNKSSPGIAAPQTKQ